MDKSYKEFKKSQTFHTRCAVCGHTFTSNYDKTLKAFPIFHPNTNPNKMRNSCESKFYESLMHVYAFLYRQSQSITVEYLVNKFDWRNKMIMKKEAITWWLARGYLNLDDLRRIIIPPPLNSLAGEIFAADKLDSENELERAIEMLKAALQCIDSDLTPVSPDDMPFKNEMLNLGETTLYEKIDTSKVNLKREKQGMVTRNQTGAQRINQRMSCASSSMERKRQDKRS
ncbi:hypothetical protein GF373_14545 [bacterium]|nr:hypothetical protein [bacterium]